MSCAEHPTPNRSRAQASSCRAGPVGAGPGLAAVLTGCGAGQITQTATQVPSVNGANGSVGPIAIRDVQLAAPGNAQRSTRPVRRARLIVTIVNTGAHRRHARQGHQPAVTTITIDGSATGTKALPGGFAVASGVDTDDMTVNPAGGSSVTGADHDADRDQRRQPAERRSSSPSGSASPSTAKPSASRAPALPGKVTIELVGIKAINGGALRAGMTIPVTFYFAHAGQVTLPQVPTRRARGRFLAAVVGRQRLTRRCRACRRAPLGSPGDEQQDAWPRGRPTGVPTAAMRWASGSAAVRSARRGAPSRRSAAARPALARVGRRPAAHARPADRPRSTSRSPGRGRPGSTNWTGCSAAGIVPGAVVLLAGEPGVGKSTLLLEVAHRWAGRSAQAVAVHHRRGVGGPGAAACRAHR